MSRDQAARILAGYADGGTPEEMLASPNARRRAYRRAAQQTHPDVPGGDPEAFRYVAAARDLLDRTQGVTSA
jgi:curved DNA-binding protein CbpA